MCYGHNQIDSNLLVSVISMDLLTEKRLIG